MTSKALQPALQAHIALAILRNARIASRARRVCAGDTGCDGGGITADA